MARFGFGCLLLLCATVPATAGDGDFVLSIDDVHGVVGERVTVEVVLDAANELQGILMGVCHDPDLLDLENEDIEIVIDEPAGMLAYASVTETDGTVGFTASILPGIIFLESLPAESDQVLFEVTYELIDPGSGVVEFCDELGKPNVPTRVIEDGEDLEPELCNGDVEVQYGFLRGDVDGDGVAAEITDATVILYWAYLSGDEPPCLRAADFNGNGVVEALIDPISLLNYAFNDGPEPPAPGTEECGGDFETELTCEVEPTCP